MGAAVVGQGCWGTVGVAPCTAEQWDPREAPAPTLELTQRQHPHPRGLQSRKCAGEPSGVTDIQPGSRSWKRRYLLEELDRQEGRVAALVSIYQLLLSGPFGLDKLIRAGFMGRARGAASRKSFIPPRCQGPADRQA